LDVEGGGFFFSFDADSFVGELKARVDDPEVVDDVDEDGKKRKVIERLGILNRAFLCKVDYVLCFSKRVVFGLCGREYVACKKSSFIKRSGHIQVEFFIEVGDFFYDGFKTSSILLLSDWLHFGVKVSDFGKSDLHDVFFKEVRGYAVKKKDVVGSWF
jgi:hypothetical protein